MERARMTTVVRLALTAVCLFYVAQHVHWSVVVVLTLLPFNAELSSIRHYMTQKDIKHLWRSVGGYH